MNVDFVAGQIIKDLPYMWLHLGGDTSDPNNYARVYIVWDTGALPDNQLITDQRTLTKLQDLDIVTDDWKYVYKFYDDPEHPNYFNVLDFESWALSNVPLRKNGYPFYTVPYTLGGYVDKFRLLRHLGIKDYDITKFDPATIVKAPPVRATDIFQPPVELVDVETIQYSDIKTIVEMFSFARLVDAIGADACVFFQEITEPLPTQILHFQEHFLWTFATRLQDKHIEYLPLSHYNSDRIRKCMINTAARFIIIPTTNVVVTGPAPANPETVYDIPFASVKVSHANVVVIDKWRRTAQLFDPHGDLGLVGTREVFENILIDMGLSATVYGWELLEPFQYCPIISFQHLEQGPQDYSGFCVYWSLYFIILKLTNPNVDNKELIDTALSAVGEIGFSKFIRSFTFHMTKRAEQIAEALGISVLQGDQNLDEYDAARLSHYFNYQIAKNAPPQYPSYPFFECYRDKIVVYNLRNFCDKSTGVLSWWHQLTFQDMTKVTQCIHEQAELFPQLR